jgi:hypothetical protein
MVHTPARAKKETAPYIMLEKSGADPPSFDAAFLVLQT